MDELPTRIRIALEEAVVQLLDANGGDDDDVRDTVEDAIRHYEPDE